jgi:hypothetical protein
MDRRSQPAHRILGPVSSSASRVATASRIRYSEAMQGSALIEGRRYAYREKRSAGSEMLKVKLVAKVGRRGMVKIGFEVGPHPGLEEYVRTTTIVVPWGERAAFLRNEQRHAALDAYGKERRDPAIEEAVSAVLASSGEPSAGAWGGLVGMAEAEIHRIMRRAGIEGDAKEMHPLGFFDPSTGNGYLPLECGETSRERSPPPSRRLSRCISTITSQSSSTAATPPASATSTTSCANTCPDTRSLGSGPVSTKIANGSRWRSVGCERWYRSLRRICARPGRSAKRPGYCAGSTGGSGRRPLRLPWERKAIRAL